MPREGRAYALDGSLVRQIKKLLDESGGLVNRSTGRKRKTYSFGSGSTAGFGYAVVREIDPAFPWELEASIATPIDRAAGDWEIADETVTMFTDNVESRYYGPFVWNGDAQSFHVKFLLKTRIEPTGVVIEQGLRLPYLVTQPANPPSQCQIIAG